MRYGKPEHFYWYADALEKGIYKPLSLSEWADELEWRTRILRDVRRRRKKEEVKIWGGNYYKDEEKDRFEVELMNPLARYSKIKIGSNVESSLPIRNIQSYELDTVDSKSAEFVWRRNGYRDDISMNEGLVFPCLINMSYDDETLFDEFKKFIDTHKEEWVSSERQLRRKKRGLSMAGKGVCAYREDNAALWSEKKLLQYIDHKIWEELSCDAYRTDEALAEILEISKSTLMDTLRPYMIELCHPIRISLLRASALISKNK